MRSTCSIYIDAGYLLASAATRITGTSLRGGINVDYPALVTSLVDTARTRSGLPVLRAHWYDSAPNGVPDPTQERIGEIPKVKLRLGRFGYSGEQKGVDLRIGLDLVAHARNRASDVFFLVTGDDDLTEAVEEAQVHGVQVVLLAVPDARGRHHGMSRHLVRAADELGTIDGDAIDAAVTKAERPPKARPPAAAAGTSPSGRPVLTPLDVASRRGTAPTTPAAAPASVIAYTATSGSAGTITPGYDAPSAYDEAARDALLDGVITRVLASFHESASPQDEHDLRSAKPTIPRDIDRALLLDAADALEVYDLDDQVRGRLRNRFWEKYAQG